MNTIAQRLKEVRNQIAAACKEASRDPADVQLLAVSKTRPVAEILEARQAGQTEFGENYVQEGISKITDLAEHKELVWHFIGPIQSNKTRDIAGSFAWVHSIDRSKIARRLSEQRDDSLPPINVLIQVNIDQEETKAGVLPAEIRSLAEQISSLPRLRLRGLMAIPAATADDTERERSFASMQSLYLELQAQYDHIDTLSMGMSDDLFAAIKYGATTVRVGTAIFGSRPSDKNN
ncbi:YggS family pyridoxal phosphate-dependent enzyme [Pseudidiomarina sp.]|uniref:YggS family pyridoxal phosphate-dependent enzyme n=1 Tax=Pseudidiomarina sp. TaxID=2081707 RepID=UPI0039A551FF